MRDIVVFGTGEVGRNALPFLQKEFHLLFWVDNDADKWGKKLAGIDIKAPEEIGQWDCDMVIASTKYASEIAEQLQVMGIASERIYFCRKFQTNDTYAYEAYPLLAEKVIETGTPLVQYDLYHKEEYMTGNKKDLIFCLFFSVYTKQLIENMSRRYEDIDFSLLTNAREGKDEIISDSLKHIYYFETMADLKSILAQLPVYDVMQLQWIEWEWAYYSDIIKAKSKILNLNIGGSDFYRASDGERNYKYRIIRCADKILAQTNEIMHNFMAYYGENIADRMVVLPYGIEVLNWINLCENVSKRLLREKFQIPSERIVVSCGHNAGKAHQHMKMIEALNQLPPNVKEKIICVFPMTYPRENNEYISNVRVRLSETNLDYIILTEFMSFQKMAEYAMVSDIMIHVQTTDQLSSAMLEQMYAGSVVIAGKWLPYKSLHDCGIFFVDVDCIDDIMAAVSDVVMNKNQYKEMCIGNRDIIWKNSSWDELAPRWHAIWGEDGQPN